MSGRPKDSVRQGGAETKQGASAGGARNKLSLCGCRSVPVLGSLPPQPESSLAQNRVVTPTKRVSLTAVRKRQESETPIEPELDWRMFTRSNSSLRFGSSRSYSSLSRDSSQDESSPHTNFQEEADSLSERQFSLSNHSKLDGMTQMKDMGLSSMSPSSKLENSPSKKEERSDDCDKDAAADDDDDDDDDDGSSEEEVRKAPNELLMEFLDCVMKKDFMNAEKLCRMILIYEPNNQEALMFYPVILEKIQLDEEAAAEEGGSGDGGDDDEEGDDDDEEGDDDQSDSSSSSCEEEEDAADVVIQPPRPDSGIGM